MAREFLAFLGRAQQHHVMGTVAALVLVGLLGVVDFLTGYELSFSIFYLAPISLCAWYIGRRSGMMVGIVSAVVWLVADLTSGHTFTDPFLPVWNTLVRLGFFTVIVVILSKLKRAYKGQEKLVNELRDALEKVKVLSGLIPICAWCKKIRDDKGYWQQVETYVADHSNASFTHGICPECKQKFVKREQSLNQGGL